MPRIARLRREVDSVTKRRRRKCADRPPFDFEAVSAAREVANFEHVLIQFSGVGDPAKRTEAREKAERYRKPGIEAFEAEEIGVALKLSLIHI